ncbi:MAG: hypothetical protein VR75_00220 [Hyphomonadaceae bacterium BRH_c29]|nr:MAG: hypothetical protein VR75_00220 [Hyphomonadaceae bacterium BRH_c29]
MRVGQHVLSRAKGRPALGDPLNEAEIETVGAMIDEHRYLEDNPDVAEAGMRAAEHYALYGHKEPRAVDTLFDNEWYCNAHGVPHSSGLAPMVHFLRAGRWVGMTPYPDYRSYRERLMLCGFSPEFYAANTPGANGSLLRPVEHMLLSQRHFEKVPHPDFDSDYYLNTHIEPYFPVRNPFVHYAMIGRDLGNAPRAQMAPDYQLLKDSRYVTPADWPGAFGARNAGFYHPYGRFAKLESLAEIKSLGWFDANWYRQRYVGRQVSAGEAFLDYLRRGRAIGHLPRDVDTSVTAQEATLRDGGFDADFYTSHTPAVQITGEDPLKHFMAQGADPTSDPAPYFESKWYARNYPGVAATGLNPFYHFLTLGKIMGHQPNPADAMLAEDCALMKRNGFDPDFYIASYPGLGLNRDQALRHYATAGWIAGLDPCGWFSTKWYLSNYQDVRIAAINPFAHYIRYGRLESRIPSVAENQKAQLDFSAAEKIKELQLAVVIERTARQRATAFAAQLRDKLTHGRISEAESISSSPGLQDVCSRMVARMLLAWLAPAPEERVRVKAELEFGIIIRLLEQISAIGRQQYLVNLDRSSALWPALMRISLHLSGKTNHVLQTVKFPGEWGIQEIERLLNLPALSETVDAPPKRELDVTVSLLRLDANNLGDQKTLRQWISHLGSGAFVLLHSDTPTKHKQSERAVVELLESCGLRAVEKQISNSLTEWQVFPS